MTAVKVGYILIKLLFVTFLLLATVFGGFLVGIKLSIPDYITFLFLISIVIPVFDFYYPLRVKKAKN